MEISALLAEIHLDYFLGVVPGAARIGHENSLEQPEECDPNQIADEEIRIKERQGQREAEDHDEDVPHPFLGIFSADAHHLFAVLVRRRLGVEPHIFLDINHRAIRAGHHRLARRPREPVNHRATHDQAKDNFRLHNT